MAINLKGRSFLTLEDFTPAEIRYLLDLGHNLKAKRRAGICDPTLQGKHIVLLFEKTSTRTRCSFEVAATQEGATSPIWTPAAARWARRSLWRTPPKCWAGFRRHRVPGLRPEGGGGSGEVRRCARLERSHRRRPPHPDPGGHDDH